MVNDRYIVEYRSNEENGKFQKYEKTFESESALEVIAHLTAVHNNKGAVNSKVRVTRIANGHRDIVHF